ncbi:maltoporin [Niveibacterium terrae]|uniref:maltoporin n=1 Tax=Niveibacterium terrae TaxID=3373598 RepID=UPI003A8F9021
MKTKFTLRVIASAVMLMSAGAMASPGVTSNGYIRAGIGAAGDGRTTQCFGLGPAKYRLGNECDDYAEIGVDAELPTMSNGTVWKMHTMLASDASYRQNGGLTDSTTKVNWSQMYASGHNLGTGVLQGASIWVGRRYYDRPDIHMLDYKYLNGDGDGAGIENLDLGFAKLSYAIERTANNYNGASTDKTDTNYYSNLFRLDGIKLHTDGYLTGIAGFTKGIGSRDGAYQAPNGWYLGGFYDVKFGDINAWHRFGLEYGKGSNANGQFGQVKAWSSGSAPVSKQDSTLQVFDSVNYTSADGHWTMLGTALYRKDKFDAAQWAEAPDASWFGYTEQQWMTVGARPHYHFNEIWGAVTEIGWTQLKRKKSDGSTLNQNLTKATVALTAAAGRSAFARPEVRLYYTYAKWNEAAKGYVATDAYGDKTTGSSMGVQVESWW